MTIPNARPLQAIGMNIDDLFDEAKGWLDGTAIETEEQASEVGKLRDMIRDAEKAAKAAKATEREPYASQVKAIDADWKPVLDKAELAKRACNNALAPFIVAKEKRQRAEAEAARAEADRLAQEARDARAGADGDLARLSAGETMLKAARDADAAAGKLEKAKPQVAGGNRAIGLRTTYRAEVTDYTAFARWAWLHRRTEYEAFLVELADREARRGPVSIPGVTIRTERKAA